MSIRLETSKRTGINNDQDSQITQFDINICSKYLKEFPRAIKRTEICPLYNCHGLTFASRRTKIIERKFIEFIIRDDNYRLIELKDVLPGDIVMYYSENGDPNHSGIVVEMTRFGPLVCSKWGNSGEFIHLFNECPKIYGRIVKYYRCSHDKT
jgi:hypothetical protein